MEIVGGGRAGRSIDFRRASSQGNSRQSTNGKRQRRQGFFSTRHHPESQNPIASERSRSEIKSSAVQESPLIPTPSHRLDGLEKVNNLSHSAHSFTSSLHYTPHATRQEQVSRFHLVSLLVSVHVDRLARHQSTLTDRLDCCRSTTDIL